MMSFFPFNTRARLGAWLWLGCLQFFIAEQITTLGWVGHYSFRRNFISDLGARTCGQNCSHWHALMNCSFVLQGVLIAGGALLLPYKVSPGWLGRTSRVFLLLAALGIVAIGTAPEDVDLFRHIAGARLHFLSGSLGMLFWGISLLSHRRWDKDSASVQARVTLLAAALAIIGDLLLIFASGSTVAWVGIGAVERLAAYPFPLWLAWTGYTLLRSPGVDKGAWDGE